MRAQYTIVNRDYKHNIVFIEDIANTTGGCTITNDAEAVFKNLDTHYSHDAPTPGYWRVVYKDTDGEWWEIVPNQVMGVFGIRFEKWHGFEWDALKGNV